MKRLAALFLLAAFAGAAPSLAQAPARPPMVSAEYGYWPPAFALTQQRLMAKTLDGMQPQRPGVRDVYVLSVGLHGGHVFENEAAQGAAALTSHFGAQGRTIVLSNDHRAGEPPRYPAAVPQNIQASLARLAETMDKNEDVAVIFFTSHGSQNVGLAGFEPLTSGGERPLRDFVISPGALRGALDASGIKNRIVIISACFSGQFVPTLQDANTIVMTAASAAKSSFGCQPERDWTYFGDALFQQSLPNAKALTGAFENARRLIAQWEGEQKLAPSEPQLFIGAEMGKVLADVEKNRGG